MDLNAIIARISERAVASGFDSSVKFDLGSDGVIVIDGEKVSTEDGPADCTITISKDNFEALAAGDLNPTMAYMQGKLKVAGDMTLAMKLSQLL